MNRAPGRPPPSSALLAFDAAHEAERIVEAIRAYVAEAHPRRGVVVGMSGDVDTALCAALAVRAVGATAVFGLMLPERESSSAALLAAVRWAEQLGIDYDVQDITSVLEVVGCYRRRDEIVRRLIPELRNGAARKRLRVFDAGAPEHVARYALVAADAEGREREWPLSDEEYRAIVAAAEMKQRTRAMLAYYHADRLAYLVLGTADRLAYALGLVAKAGDAAADIMPIAHLHRTELRELARHLGISAANNDRSLGAGSLLPREWVDWRLSLPQDAMDGALRARDDGYDSSGAAPLLGLPVDQVEQAFAEIERGCAEATYVRQPARLIERSVPSSFVPSDVEPIPGIADLARSADRPVGGADALPS